MYTTKDVDRHNKGLSDKRKRQWVAVANSHITKCMSEGGEEGTCAAEAIRIANGVVKTNEMENYSLKTIEYTIRTGTYKGKKQLIVPVVMMVEGVHCGSHGPLLHQANELGKFPASWNGIPVMIGHPAIDGYNVSANSPEVLEQSVGRVFNAYMDEKKLKAEVWLDEQKLLAISPTALSYIQEGRQLDVSIGVFTDEEQSAGVYSNEKGEEEQYVAIARNHRPDHLALLPGESGACGWADGCGIRINKKKGGMEELRSELGMTVSEFYAIPREPPSESKLPIFDADHVRNAMARFNQLKDVSEEEIKSARKKILAKAKKFEIDVSNFQKTIENNMLEESILTMRKANIENMLASITDNKQGYRELVDEISSKLYSNDNESEFYMLEEVFEDSFVYRKSSRDEGGSGWFEQAYSKKENGDIEFDGDPVPVRRNVSYVQLNAIVRTKFNTNKKGDQKMPENDRPCCLEKVVELLGNKQLGFTEAEDREWLLGLGPERLARMTPKEPEVIEVNKVVEPDLSAYIAKDSLKTAEDVLAIIPEEMKEQFQSGLALHNAHRVELIQSILSNSNEGVWTEEELQANTTSMLEKLNKQFKIPVDYSGQGAGTGLSVNSEKDGEILLPVNTIF